MNGDTVLMDPRQTYWYRNYVQFPKVEDTSFQRKFRNRFRLAYESFKSLLEVVSNSTFFKRWVVTQIIIQIPKVPISLLLLGSFTLSWTWLDI